MQVRPASRVYRTWGMDSRRWDRFRPRRDDIVIEGLEPCLGMLGLEEGPTD